MEREEAMSSIADVQVEAIDWSAYQECYGSASGIGGALRDLIHSIDVESGTLAWDRIEEHVFSQGDIYSVAEPTVTVVLAALAEQQLPWSLGRLLDLLLFVVRGDSLTDPGLRNRVKAKALEGLWLLTRIAVTSEGWVQDCVLDVIDVIAPDHARIIRNTTRKNESL